MCPIRISNLNLGLGAQEQVLSLCRNSTTKQTKTKSQRSGLEGPFSKVWQNTNTEEFLFHMMPLATRSRPTRATILIPIYFLVKLWERIWCKGSFKTRPKYMTFRLSASYCCWEDSGWRFDRTWCDVTHREKLIWNHSVKFTWNSKRTNSNVNEKSIVLVYKKGFPRVASVIILFSSYLSMYF